MGDPILQIKHLETVYNEIVLAVKGISLSVEQNKIVALLGSNGAGKTTILRSICGILKSVEGKIKKGSIEFMGHQINNMDAAAIVRMGISQVPEGRMVFEHLTVRENLRVGAFVQREKVKTDIERILTIFPPLRSRLGELAGYLSGGEQQMMVIGRALMSHPKLLLLDEPSLGLAPLIIDEIFDTIKQINQEERTTILLVEQNAMMALSASSYGYIIENGKIVLDGPSANLKTNEDIKEFYLGLTDDSKRKSYEEIKHYKRRKRWLS
jgi:branched-chain amino acid transport system ATP-binding protein